MEQASIDRPRGTVQLRVLNTRSVLNVLRQVGAPARIAELAARTSLTRPTVAQIVASLEDKGYVQRYEPIEAAGRPAARYGLAGNAFAVLGADAGAHRVVVSVVTLDGATRARRERRQTTALGDPMLDVLSRMAQECLDEIGLPPSAILAGTVASPGIIDRASGRITLRPGLGEWDVPQVVSTLEARIGVAVTIENDANLAARAMCAVPDMPQTFLGLQWGERLGAGIVLDGRLYRGQFGAAGELGSLLLTDPATGDVHYLEEVVVASKLPAIAGAPEASTQDLVAGAEAGDRRALEALRRGVDRLAGAVAPVCLGLDLHTVTISGAIARSGPALVAAFRERLAAHGAADVECRLSPFHEDTVLRGAIDDAVDAGWNRLLDDCGPLTSTAAALP